MSSQPVALVALAGPGYDRDRLAMISMICTTTTTRTIRLITIESRNFRAVRARRARANNWPFNADII